MSWQQNQLSAADSLKPVAFQTSNRLQSNTMSMQCPLSQKKYKKINYRSQTRGHYDQIEKHSDEDYEQNDQELQDMQVQQVVLNEAEQRQQQERMQEMIVQEPVAAEQRQQEPQRMDQIAIQRRELHTLERNRIDQKNQYIQQERQELKQSPKKMAPREIYLKWLEKELSKPRKVPEKFRRTIPISLNDKPQFYQL